MIILKNINLIDGITDMPKLHTSIAIQDNRIKEIGEKLSISETAFENASVLDLEGMWVMPGLIEAHLHMGGRIEILDRRLPIFGGRALTSDYADLRESSLRYGITTVRSCGDFAEDALWLREQTERKRLVGPRIVTCGRSFQKMGGHPNATVWGNDPVTLAAAAAMPETEEEARRMVRTFVEDGVDFIKIIINDLDLLHGKKKMPKIDRKIVEAITQEAHRHHKLVAVHCENIYDAKAAVLAGVDDIEHMILPSYWELQNFREEDYEDVLDLMAERGTYFTPTAYVTMYHDGKTAKEDYDSMPRLFYRAWEKGVKLTMGTDSGAPGVYHGLSLHKELEVMVKGQGIPPMAVIQAATRLNAELMGMSDEIGTAETGKLADLVVIGENPLNDISNTQKVVMVIKDGRIVYDSILSDRRGDYAET